MERIKESGFNIAGERFSTFAEMYRVCESRQLNTHYSTDYGAKQKREVHSDKGVMYSWEQTKQDILFGSTLFDEDYERIEKEINHDVEEYMKNYHKVGRKKDVIGQSVLVERAMMGHPKAFNRRVVERRKQKTVHFMYNITCAWHASTEDRMKSGCILMAVASAMEKMGYQTAITFTPYFSYWRSEEPSLLAEVQIKDYKTRFNKKKIQFPLAAESTLFQLGCWWMHRTPEGKSNWGGGEGICVDYDSYRKQQAINYAKSKKAIYLSSPMMIKKFKLDVNKVFDYVFEELKNM